MTNNTLSSGLPGHADSGPEGGTSTIVIDAGPGTGAVAVQARDRSASPSASGRPARSGITLGGVLRSERIKLSSLRSVKITLLVTSLMGIGLSALMALMWSSQVGQGPGALPAGPEGSETYLLLVSTFTAPFLALVFGVLGVFAISSEYSSGMILSTLAAVPKRTPVFVAKAIVLAGFAALTALVLVVAGLALGVAFMPASAAELASARVISGAGGAIAYLVLIALLAYGVAALTRSTAGGIAIIVGLTFVLPIGFQLLTMTGWEWVTVASQYLPSNLGNTLTGGITAPVDGLLGFWAALAAMIAWAAVALIPAGAAFVRRDAK